MRCDRRAALAHSPEDALEIRFNARGLDSPIRRVAHRVQQACRRNERLARHAAEVETIPAHLVPFDERDTSAESGRPSRRDQTRGASADDDDVVDSFAFTRVHRDGRGTTGSFPTGAASGA